MVSNSALFCLATYLATFQKMGQFFPNHLVTLLAKDKRVCPSVGPSATEREKKFYGVSTR
jgi:hypothetical protein